MEQKGFGKKHMLALILFILTAPVLAAIMAHNKEVQKWLIPLGAGLLLATVLTHMLPEAFEHYSAKLVSWSVVGGFGLCFILSSFISVCPHDDSHCENVNHKGVTWLLIIGFIVHAMLDGLALYAFSANELRDAMAGLAIHRAVDGIAIVALAKHYNVEKRTIGEWIGLIVLSTLVGYGAGAFGMQLPGGIMEGFVSGTMLYIIATDMIPAVHKNNQRTVNVVALLMGFLIAYTLSSFTIHGS